jgi:hypothetical protein
VWVLAKAHNPQRAGLAVVGVGVLDGLDEQLLHIAGVRERDGAQVLWLEVAARIDKLEDQVHAAAAQQDRLEPPLNGHVAEDVRDFVVGGRRCGRSGCGAFAR